MILSPGVSFGAYTIVGPIGRGGMGELYRARDNRLGREVALKILRQDGASNPDRIRRFELEARAASSLNHPNIVVLYEVGEAEAPGQELPLRYIAMELLAGEPLNVLLASGPLPMRRFLDLSSQIAEGLARAHESGIVHRDLKPSNIFVSPDGHAKILDFGLAKLRPLPAEASTDQTLTQETLTSSGAVMGTVGYMSPEQARGEPATAASDQFSFGCVLYEMLTGRRPFRGRSQAETLSAILRDDPPPIQESNPKVPAPICWIVERCLSKLDRDRYASSRDLARDLQTYRDHLSDSSVGSGARPARTIWSRLGPRATLAALFLIAVGAAAVLLTRAPEPRLETEFRRLTFREGTVSRALYTPRSNTILYAAAWDGQPVGSFLTLPDSIGGDRSLDSEPQLPLDYSADGSQVLVLLGVSRPSINARGALAWWPALGGKPRRVLERAGWADWAEKGRFFAVVGESGGQRTLDIRDAEGTLKRTLFRTEGAIAYVRISEDETQIAFIHHPSRRDDAGEVRVIATDGSRSRALTPKFERCAGLDWNSRTGQVWFTASRGSPYSNSLYSAKPDGDWHLIQAFPDYFILQTISKDGQSCLLLSSESRINMTVHRTAQTARDLSWLGSSVVFDISRDDRQLLFNDGGATSRTIGTWIRPLEGGDASRLADCEPGAFSPDGRSVIGLTRPLSGPQQLLLVPVGAGRARQLTSAPASHSFPTFAGPRTILFVRTVAKSSEVWRIDVEGRGAQSLGAPGCNQPVASPSGNSFLCRGGENGGVVFTYPMTGGAGRPVYELPGGEQILYARWDATGERIFILGQDGALFVLDASRGTLLRHEASPLPETARNYLVAAALNADATIRVFSINHFMSSLYQSRGL